MHDDFNDWFELKPTLDQKELDPSFYVKEGEVWWCHWGKNIGIEINGKGKRLFRPAVVIRVFNRNHLWVIPFGSVASNTTFDVPVPSINNSFAFPSQIRTFSSKRLFKIMDVVSKETLNILKLKVVHLLNIEPAVLCGGFLAPSLMEGNNKISIPDVVLDAIDEEFYVNLLKENIL